MTTFDAFIVYLIASFFVPWATRLYVFCTGLDTDYDGTIYVVEDRILSFVGRFILRLKDSGSPHWHWLGGCIICTNWWLSLIFHPIISVAAGISLYNALIFAVPAAVFAYFWQQVTQKLI